MEPLPSPEFPWEPFDPEVEFPPEFPLELFDPDFPPESDFPLVLSPTPELDPIGETPPP